MRRAILTVMTAAITVAGCVPRSTVLVDLVEARKLAAGMHVEFTKAVEASNRAVMADTDAASEAAADEARQARERVEQDRQALVALVRTLRYAEDAQLLEALQPKLEAYNRLDDEILPLAVENTNLKAQRLSFGAARDAVAEFRSALAADSGAGALRAQIGILDILAAQAPHIAEADDQAMTRMESAMAAAERQTRGALAQVSSGPRAHALAALDRFMAINAEIVELSRRNTNVRSLALALGKKPALTAACEAAITAIEQALGRHEFRATR